MPETMSIGGEIKVNAYAVMQECVESGIRYGWRRAHKHTDNPTEEQVQDSIEAEVMNAILEKFHFHSEMCTQQ